MHEYTFEYQPAGSPHWTQSGKWDHEMHDALNRATKWLLVCWENGERVAIRVVERRAGR